MDLISRQKTIKVKMLADIEPPVVMEGGDWVDLRAAETVIMSKGEYKAIRLGVAMELPEGYEALVIPRSSTYKTHHIISANSIGLIDESYCGNGDEWRFPAIALASAHIHKGERICQFRIIRHQPRIAFDIVDDLGHADRGGLGSTGTR